MDAGDEHRVKLEAMLVSHPSLAGARVLLAQLSGSLGFNLAVATSDEDYFGVYAASIHSTLLGTRKVSLSGADPDFETHEVEEMLLLLGKGNPKVIEPLFTENLVWKSAEWRQLEAAIRPLVLSQKTINQYRHYAKSQKGDDAVTPLKKRYHAMRLALEANRIAVGVGTPLVFFPDGPERDWLLALRTNPDTMTQEAFVERFHQLLEPTRSNLHGYPPETDVAAMEPALVQLRMGQLAQLPQPVAVAMPVAGDEHGALAARARALLQRAGLADCPLLFVGRSGSTLHGMRPGPADDVIGVFVGPLARALGFETNQLRRVSEWQGQVLVQTNAKGDKRNDNNARGVVLYEVSTALSLLLCGSRRLIEQLWAPPAELAEDATFEAQWWRDVVLRVRDSLRGKAAIEHWGGTARGARASQQLYQCALLVRGALDMMNGNAPRTGAQDEDMLQRLRVGAHTADDVAALEEQLEQLKGSKKSAGYAVDDAEARAWLSTALIALRRAQY